MFEKVQVPVLGQVENLAVHVCPQCGHAEHIFGQGGGEPMAETYGVPTHGSLPQEIAISAPSAAGNPIAADEHDTDEAQAQQQTETSDRASDRTPIQHDNRI